MKKSELLPGLNYVLKELDKVIKTMTYNTLFEKVVVCNIRRWVETEIRRIEKEMQNEKI